MADEPQPKTEPTKIITNGTLRSVQLDPNGMGHIEIVPPSMSDKWRRFRVHMGAVQGYAELAVEAATTELARTYVGSASAALMDADFVLRMIEKENDRGSGDQEPVNNDRG